MGLNKCRAAVAALLLPLLNGAAYGFAPSDDNFPPPRQTDYEIQTPTYLSDYFIESSGDSAAPDSDGFIRRWMLLEPISKPNRSNVVFTDSYLNEVLDSVYYKGRLETMPRDGEKVRVGKGRLVWHALDSRMFNVKLYRFAAALKKPVYGVIFDAVTIIDCPEEMRDVRLSVGSNSASKWWLNGEPVLVLSGDSRMVADDCMSPRLTLQKGRNVLRGTIINGTGMSDFCVRFVDADGRPLTDFSTRNR